jgi:hypothetical protein
MPISELLERLRKDDSPYGVVASFRGECEPGGDDVRRWKVFVTDGTSGGVVHVQLVGSRAARFGTRVDAGALERATERLALRFPPDARAAGMLAESERVGALNLRSSDLS